MTSPLGANQSYTDPTPILSVFTMAELGLPLIGLKIRNLVQANGMIGFLLNGVMEFMNVTVPHLFMLKKICSL